MSSSQSALCQDEQSQLFQLSSQERNFSLWVIFVALLWMPSNRSISFLCWGPQNQMQHSRWGLTWAWYWGRTTFLSLLATCLVMHRRRWLGFWAASTHCWGMSGFSSTNTPTSCSQGAVLIHCLILLLHLCLRLRLSQPRCGTSHLALLNLRRLHRPTSQICPGPSGWHPCPPACQQHHRAWCLCWTHWVPLSISVILSMSLSTDPWRMPQAFNLGSGFHV